MSTEIVISGTGAGALWEPEAIMTSVPGPTQIRTETCHWTPLLHRKRKTWRRRKNQSFQHRIFDFLPPPLLWLLLHKRICACINTLPSAHTFQPCWAILGDFGPLGTLLVILSRLQEKDVTKHPTGLSFAHSSCWNAEHTPSENYVLWHQLSHSCGHSHCRYSHAQLLSSSRGRLCLEGHTAESSIMEMARYAPPPGHSCYSTITSTLQYNYKNT